ncbi:MAG: Crp/Fnr family transcriptional regulator [Rhodobacteraceae bacterium]|nr:Crp/Fnr family transcriptional regulator [Paracoccaceae bacterium]
MQRNNKNQHPCGNCAFYGESIWQPVAGDSVSVLMRGFTRKNLQNGQSLYLQGSEGSGVFCVSKGLIALRTHHMDGSSTLLRLAYPGEIIGFRAFLGNRPHQTEAIALLPSRICTVARRGANQIMRANPEVLAQLAARCIDEIDRNHAQIIATATTSNKQRLKDLMLFLMEKHGRPVEAGHLMRLPLSRSDLADLLGVQPETLSRLIKRLEEDGFCSITGRNVLLSSPSLSHQKIAQPQ